MIKTRFAPSPTGYLHLGGARTALYSWLYARQQGGKFVLRIEDTDLERSTPEAVEAILEGMRWLGLDWDEGPYFQTERMEQYQAVVQILLDQDRAYHCYCSREELDIMRAEQMADGKKPRYDGRCRHRSAPESGVSPVVRLRSPQYGDVVFRDLIRGEIRTSNAELDDLILLRSDGSPTYNLTVVVDDADMGITHVIRGDDHINNTPRQINIARALEADSPEYAHVPMILGVDGKRLSKRHGAISVMQYAEERVFPEAMLNALVRLGWSHGDQEIFSLQEMLEYFSLNGVSRSAAKFDPDKLAHLNQHYLRSLPLQRVVDEFLVALDSAGVNTGAGPDISELVAVQRERTRSLSEMVTQSVCFYRNIEEYDEKAAAKFFKPKNAEVLQSLYESLEALGSWHIDVIDQAIRSLADELDLKLGKIAQPLRLAVTGGTVSPSIDQTLYLLGKEMALHRIQAAITTIRAMNQ